VIAATARAAALRPAGEPLQGSHHPERARGPEGQSEVKPRRSRSVVVTHAWAQTAMVGRMPRPAAPGSQAPSDLDFALDAVTADVLAGREAARRDGLRARGAVGTGCREMDEGVLLGEGFERGAVVGVSAEGENVGLVVSSSLFFPCWVFIRCFVFPASGTDRQIA
jgi:hypothetical protein